MGDEPNTDPVPAGLDKKLFFGVAAIAVLATAAAGYFWWQGSRNDPSAAAEREARALVAEVGELIVLPEDEEPVIATVSDPELLKDEAFFAKAQKGDKVLIYNGARKAILYNPAEHRIVEVAPLNIGNGQ